MITLHLSGGISATFMTPEDAVAFLRAYQVSAPSVMTTGGTTGFLYPQPLGSSVRGGNVCSGCGGSLNGKPCAC